MDDLLGPANGPREEVVGMSVRDRYLVGKLAPKTVGSSQASTASPLESIEPEAKQNPNPKQLEPYAGHNEPGAEFNSADGGSDLEEGRSAIARGFDQPIARTVIHRFHVLHRRRRRCRGIGGALGSLRTGG